MSKRVYSPYADEAARLLGAQISRARRERRWSAQELADRVGITRTTLSKVERGDPSVGLGVAFEAAALVGVPLFHDDYGELREDAARARDRLALLPQRIRARKEPVKDDF
jgi:transcriptional regulator with XRE-family HTH domain